jgi:hypothetical protein
VRVRVEEKEGGDCSASLFRLLFCAIAAFA